MKLEHLNQNQNSSITNVKSRAISEKNNEIRKCIISPKTSVCQVELMLFDINESSRCILRVENRGP